MGTKKKFYFYLFLLFSKIQAQPVVFFYFYFKGRLPVILFGSSGVEFEEGIQSVAGKKI